MSFEYERHDLPDLCPENLGAARVAFAAMVAVGFLCGAALVVGFGILVCGVWG